MNIFRRPTRFFRRVQGPLAIDANSVICFGNAYYAAPPESLLEGLSIEDAPDDFKFRLLYEGNLICDWEPAYVLSDLPLHLNVEFSTGIRLEVWNQSTEKFEGDLILRSQYMAGAR